MKRYAATIMIASAMIMSLLALPGWAGKSRIERAVVQFDEPVKLLDVMLKGEYLFVHDEEKMARGETCTYVYAHDKGKQGELLVSFHCIPAARERADQFTAVVKTVPSTTLNELIEYQFAGSIEGHQVPHQK
ncbi:MAG TPA: hypothetical protein VKC34_17645 [Blastocatellia bacterium]|nr:hypothetical protein [Blastocatellia bacterium]